MSGRDDDICFICFVIWEEDFSFFQLPITDKRLILNNLFSFSISVLDYITSCSYSKRRRKNTGVIFNSIFILLAFCLECRLVLYCQLVQRLIMPNN